MCYHYMHLNLSHGTEIKVNLTSATRIQQEEGILKKTDNFFLSYPIVIGIIINVKDGVLKMT